MPQVFTRENLVHWSDAQGPVGGIILKNKLCSEIKSKKIQPMLFFSVLIISVMRFVFDGPVVSHLYIWRTKSQEKWLLQHVIFIWHTLITFYYHFMISLFRYQCTNCCIHMMSCLCVTLCLHQDCTASFISHNSSINKFSGVLWLLFWCL